MRRPTAILLALLLGAHCAAAQAGDDVQFEISDLLAPEPAPIALSTLPIEPVLIPVADDTSGYARFVPEPGEYSLLHQFFGHADDDGVELVTYQSPDDKKNDDSGDTKDGKKEEKKEVKKEEKKEKK
jgi:hypothetical protein